MRRLLFLLLTFGILTFGVLSLKAEPVAKNDDDPYAIKPTIRTTDVKQKRIMHADVEVPSVTPRDAAVLALADANAVALLNDPEIPVSQCRYLSLHNLSREKRIVMKKLIDFMINSLSTKRIIVRTAGIPNNDPDPLVIRINLYDYGISPKAFDDLVANGSGQTPIPEPYFHQLLTTTEEETVTETHTDHYLVKYGDNRTFNMDVPKVNTRTTGKKVKKTKQVQAAAGWLLSPQEVILVKANPSNVGATVIGQLATITHTFNPIIRADWFLTYASWAPAYYELLGLDPVNGKLEDFEKILRVDVKQASASQIAAVSDTKIVALHNRILLRVPTVNGYLTGYYWETSDTASGIDDEDYLNSLANFDHPRRDAAESIGTLLNSLQAYALADGANKLLNVANVNVARHSNTEPTKLNDVQVYSARNCIFCHKDGMYPIKDQVRDISSKQIALFITQSGFPHDVAEKINDAFQPSHVGAVRHDQEIYKNAVAACNGMTSAENAQALEDTIYDYYDNTITMDRLAWDVGWPAAKLDAVLRRGVGIDHTLTGLLQTPPVPPSLLPWERQGVQALELYIVGLENQAALQQTTVEKIIEKAGSVDKDK